MSFSFEKKNNVKQPKYEYAEKSSQNVERSYQSDLVCNIVLNEILTKSENILSHKHYINKLILRQKCKQAQKFTMNSCSSFVQNFFAEHECLSPKMVYEKSPCSPIRSPHSFLQHQQLASKKQINNSLTVKRQLQQRRRDSSKIYNCNKIFIVKKSKKTNDLGQQSSPSSKNIDIDSKPSSFTGRYSHKDQVKRISINNNNVFVPRLSNRGRLTVNPYPASTRNSPKNTYCQTDMPQKNRSSIFSFKQNTENRFDNSQLVKLQLKKPNSEQKSFKTIQKQKQINTYISFLRDKKVKLENIMKDFDDDQIVKKNQKTQRDFLMRQSKTQNLAQTFNKVPSVTTDYNGHLMRVHDPKLFGQLNQMVKQNSQNRLPKYQSNNQGVSNNNVGFKIKDIDDQTKSFLNQIFSSVRSTPSKKGKKIASNGSDQQKKSKEKVQNNSSLNGSYTYLEKQNIRGKGIFQTSMKSFEKKLMNGKGKPAKTFQKFHLKKKSEIPNQNLGKQNDLNIQAGNLKKSSKTDMILKSNGNQETNFDKKDSKKVKPSLADLQKIFRQQYDMKKERIHPKMSKSKKYLNSDQQNGKEVQQLSSQNNQKTIVNSHSLKPSTFFQAILNNLLE